MRTAGPTEVFHVGARAAVRVAQPVTDGALEERGGDEQEDEQEDRQEDRQEAN